MKKIFLFFFLFFIFPIFGFAADVKIDQYLVDAYLLDNGDLEINELILADGSFNWYETDLLYKNNNLTVSNDLANNAIYNARDIELISIQAKPTDSISFATFNEEFKDFELDNFATDNVRYKYKKTLLDGGYRYRLYYKAVDEKVALYLKYVIKDAAVVHNDVAELYWTFISDDFALNLNNVKIQLHLPEADNSNYFRFWGHGALNGEISQENNQTIIAEVDEIYENESLDIRVTFAKNLINSSKKSNITAFEEILQVEQKRAAQVNALKIQALIVKIITIMYYLALIICVFLVYFFFKKSPKTNFYSKYNREFIDDYNVEVIDYLMNHQITPNALSASIMNLIYKKNLTVQEIKDAKIKEYEFTLVNTDNLNNTELMLVNFLFGKVSKNKVNSTNQKIFTTKDLKEYAKGTHYQDFINSYTAWKNQVIADAQKENFYENNYQPKIIGMIMLIIGMVIFFIGTGMRLAFILTTIILIPAIAFFIYCLVITKKTPKGALHYAKWNAFKNFLDDFGTFELKELPEIALWERYLVYATIFGLATKVQKAMNVHIKEINMDDYNYVPSFIYFDIGHVISNSVTSAVNNAYHQASSSSMASGSGFGGGFSGGGGFGGGGHSGRFG